MPQLAPDSLCPELRLFLFLWRDWSSCLDQALVVELGQTTVGLLPFLLQGLLVHVLLFRTRTNPHISDLVSLHAWHPVGLLLEHGAEALFLSLASTILHHEVMSLRHRPICPDVQLHELWIGDPF